MRRARHSWLKQGEGIAKFSQWRNGGCAWSPKRWLRLWRREELHDLVHDTSALVRLEEKLSVRGAIQDDQLLWLRGAFVLLEDPGQPFPAAAGVVTSNDEQGTRLQVLCRQIGRRAEQYDAVHGMRRGFDGSIARGGAAKAPTHHRHRFSAGRSQVCNRSEHIFGKGGMIKVLLAWSGRAPESAKIDGQDTEAFGLQQLSLVPPTLLLESAAVYETIRYEGYGPGKVALIVETLTDNRNRTASNVRSTFSKYGGAMGEMNSVSFLFSHIGVVAYPASVDYDAIFETAVEAGADDVVTEDSEHEVRTTMETFIPVRDALEEKFGQPVQAAMIWRPHNTVEPTAEQAETLLKLIDVLEEDDDVQTVFGNYEISDELAEKLGL